MKREDRKIIAQDTLRIIKEGVYKLKDNNEINISSEIKKGIEDTKVHSVNDLETLRNTIELPNNFETTINVSNQDVVSSIHRLKTEIGGTIMCLNFASAKNAGGGFINGAIAQEEALAISSSLYGSQMTTKGYYDLHKSMKSCVYTDTMIYSPNTVFFRDVDGNLLKNPTVCNIITSAAVNTGVVKQREPKVIKSLPELMETRIDKLFALALQNKNETLILGAWGCGVFQNEPKLIAELFAKQLNGKYKNQFKHIEFAIFSRNELFINAFKNVFIA
jgi:uncharacterized protein (TIGR02452 family)